LTSVAAVADPEQQLAWEARQRPRAGVAAILSGLLTLGGYIWAGAAFRDIPRAGFLESLGHVEAAGPIGEQQSARTPVYEFYEQHASAIVGSATARGVALVALAWALTFLGAATRGRRPEFLRLAVYVLPIGALLTAFATVVGAVGTVGAISAFLDGPRTVDAAREIGEGSLVLTAEIVGQIGPLLLVAGIFLVSLNAMRVGLLTRFLGILGIISAFLMIFPLGPLPVVQSFWLIAVGLTMLGTVPGGQPPAWRTGRPEPWPSQREAADARRRQAEARRGTREPEPQPEPVPAGRPHPVSKKRKRKRRT
jgi:hypothetical protein